MEDGGRISAACMASMFGLAAQVGVQPLLQRVCGNDELNKSLYVVLIEAIKFLLCFVAMTLSGHQLPRFDLRESLSVAGLPAVTYAIQNVLMQQAYYHVDPLTLNVIVQSKLPLTAILVYLILGKRQTPAQVVALALIAMSGLLITLDEGKGGRMAVETDFARGILPLLCGCILSAVSATICQRALQKKTRDSYLFTMELGAYGSIFLFCRLYFNGELLVPREELLRGMNPLVLLPASLYACGGIMAGLVTKYGDAIKKSISIAMGICLTAFLQYWFLDAPIHLRHYCALALLVAGTYMHTTMGEGSKSDAKTVRRLKKES